ncbi:MAG: M24 family metallopeptidase, partial [Candidatus Poribacteria bacterium]|nr:M24 family metallopeptidase [Candidatus Poribacteria bacterium]
GKRVGIDGIIEDFGADAGFPISEFGEKIPDYINKTDRIYYTLDNGPLDQQIIGFIQQNRQTRSTKGIGPNTIIDPSEFFADMRVVKNEEEIHRIRRATEITADAHLAAMRVTRPEMYEYEIAALIESIYHQAEQSYPGYKTILASGQNATILHYVDNNQQIKNNDLVLIDSGCEYKYYNGDVTRTFPANGKFTDVQRQIYQTVLETQVELISMIKPGVTIDKVNKRAIRRLTEGMIKLGLLKGDTDELIKDKKYQQFYMHNVGHMLGLDVHDVSRTADGDGYRALEPGMIMTVEPGLYVGADSKNIDPRYLGIGVRIEDNVLVTELGNEVLTEGIPKTIDEIEQVCSENQA